MKFSLACNASEANRRELYGIALKGVVVCQSTQQQQQQQRATKTKNRRNV